MMRIPCPMEVRPLDPFREHGLSLVCFVFCVLYFVFCVLGRRLILGWKKSGFGRFGSKYGFEEFLQTKTITIKFNEVL